MQLGQEIELQIDSMTLEGQTVAWFHGFVVFVAGAIPGERVRATVVTTGADFARAEVTQVLQRSPHRQRPECRHFGICGGCQWQHIAYEEQLGWKEELLRSTLRRQLPNVELPVRPVLGNPVPWGTRKKIYYRVASFKRAGQKKLLLCHPKGHSVELEPIRECPVHDAVADELARRAFLWLRERGVREAGPHEPGPGLIGVLVRRAGEGTATQPEAQVVIVATDAALPGLEGLPESLLALPGVTGVHLNIQPDPLNPYLGPETRLLAGNERLVDEVCGVRFQVSPVSFFQTNAIAARHLVETVQRFIPLEDSDPILDLYAGAGLFSIPLARAGHQVTAVEESRSAVADGIETLRSNGIEGCHFINDRVQNVLRRMPKDRRYRTIILDPPRDGCPEWAIKVIGRGQRPARIINVSCNADALANDLRLLTRSGYRISEIQPIDMFPHTSHIESVTLLERVN